MHTQTTPTPTAAAPSLTAESRVADITAHQPGAVRVFQKHGIDFCCGGRQPLAAACAAAGVQPDVVLAEIADLGGPLPEARRWDLEPVAALIDYIIETHHRPLDTEIARLRAMADRVLAVHRDKDPQRLDALRRTFAEIEAEIWPHMQKEELMLFPWLRSGEGRDVASPIRVMVHEHEVLGALLHEMRRLTEDYTPPAVACGTWRALYQGLAELEADLKLHIHLENNVLFPRALGTA